MESDDSPDIPGRRETSGTTGLPSGTDRRDTRRKIDHYLFTRQKTEEEEKEIKHTQKAKKLNIPSVETVIKSKLQWKEGSSISLLAPGYLVSRWVGPGVESWIDMSYTWFFL